MIGRNVYGNMLKSVSKQKAFLAVVLMLITMLFFRTNFYTPYNLFDIMNSTAIYAIIATGVSLVIISGGCDLSIGGMLSLSGIITIKLMNIMPMIPAMLCALAVGAIVGFMNGFLVVHQKTESFIITLGMGMVLKGIAQQITNAHPISPKNYAFLRIANGKLVGSIPNLVFIMIGVMIIGYIILRYSQFGRNLYAVGGDYDVAVYAGINAKKTKWSAYVISGVVAAFGGIMLSSKLNSASSIYGDMVPLLIHCGAVIGGTSLTGGKGGVFHTFTGLLALSVLQNCMNMLYITAYVQQLVQGIVIVAIIWFDWYLVKRKREAV